MTGDVSIATAAAIITVISMQLVTVFGEGNMDLMDFLISIVCFSFAIFALRVANLRNYSRALLGLSLALSATYTVVIPFGFIYFWFAPGLGVPALPLEFGTHQPLSFYSTQVDLPRGWFIKIELEQLIAFALIPVCQLYVFFDKWRGERK